MVILVTAHASLHSHQPRLQQLRWQSCLNQHLRLTSRLYVCLHPAGGLSIADLMKGLGDAKSKLGPARKALMKMAKQAEPLTAPLPGPIRERQERKAGYETTKEDITKWQPLVKVTQLQRQCPPQLVCFFQCKGVSGVFCMKFACACISQGCARDLMHAACGLTVALMCDWYCDARHTSNLDWLTYRPTGRRLHLSSSPTRMSWCVAAPQQPWQPSSRLTMTWRRKWPSC